MEILNVIVAAFVGFAYGAVHYTVLSKQWLAVSGVKLDENGKPAGGGSVMPFIVSGVAMLLIAGFMRHVFAMSGIDSMGKGLVAGLGIGAFFILPWVAMNNAYPGRPIKLTVIDGAYSVIGCGLIGLVLTAF